MGSQVRLHRLSVVEVANGITEALVQECEARGGGWDLDKVYLYAEDIAELDEDGEMLLPGFLHGSDPEETFDGVDVCIADPDDVATMIEELDALDPDELAALEGASDDAEDWTGVLAEIRQALVAAHEEGQGLLSVLQ